MMRRSVLFFLLVVLILSMTGCLGCGKKPVTDLTPPAAVEETKDIGEHPVVGPEGPVSADQFLKRIYFDFDKSSIRPDQVEAVTQNAAWLKAHPDTKVLIEGHCDERGTTEYNFALGGRRADAVQQFLVERGANAANVSMISKGEEEPADPGHDEAAWAKNRRAQFMFLSKPPAE